MHFEHDVLIWAYELGTRTLACPKHPAGIPMLRWLQVPVLPSSNVQHPLVCESQREKSHATGSHLSLANALLFKTPQQWCGLFRLDLNVSGERVQLDELTSRCIRSTAIQPGFRRHLKDFDSLAPCSPAETLSCCSAQSQASASQSIQPSNLALVQD